MNRRAIAFRGASLGRKLFGAMKRKTFKYSQARIRQAVKNLGETKFYSTQLTGLGSTAGTITHITPIAQGAANGQRDGLKITNREMRFRYLVQNGSTAVQAVRVIVFKWNDRYDSAPTVTDILKNDTGGASPSVTAQYALIFKDKYKILHDKTFSLAGYSVAAGNYGTVGALTNCSRKISLKGQISYVDDLAGHYEKGSIHVLVLSSNASAVVPDFTYEYLYKDN